MLLCRDSELHIYQLCLEQGRAIGARRAWQCRIDSCNSARELFLPMRVLDEPHDGRLEVNAGKLAHCRLDPVGSTAIAGKVDGDRSEVGNSLERLNRRGEFFREEILGGSLDDVRAVVDAGCVLRQMQTGDGGIAQFRIPFRAEDANPDRTDAGAVGQTQRSNWKVSL